MPLKLSFWWSVAAVFAVAVLDIIPEQILESILMPLTLATARASLTSIHWIGIEAVRDGTFINHPDGFIYQIAYRCTGIIAVSLFSVWVLAFPDTPLRLKLAGLGLGIPVLAAFNLLRLVHLFNVGVHTPALFDLAHEVVWQGLIAVQIVGLCLGWALWSVTRQKKVKHSRIAGHMGLGQHMGSSIWGHVARRHGVTRMESRRELGILDYTGRSGQTLED